MNDNLNEEDGECYGDDVDDDKIRLIIKEKTMMEDPDNAIKSWRVSEHI